MKVGHQFFSLSEEKPLDIQKIRNLKSEYLNDKIKKEDFIDRVLKLIQKQVFYRVKNWVRYENGVDRVY